MQNNTILSFYEFCECILAESVSETDVFGQTGLNITEPGVFPVFESMDGFISGYVAAETYEAAEFLLSDWYKTNPIQHTPEQVLAWLDQPASEDLPF